MRPGRQGTMISPAEQRLTAPPLAVADRWLALAGIVGPVVLVATFVVLGLLRPGYSPVRQAVSDLGVGPNGWVLDASAVFLGVLLIAFAVGFGRTQLPVLGSRGRWLCPALLSLPGLGFITVGFFTEAPPTLLEHSLASAVALLGGAAAFLGVGLELRRDRRWRRWAVYSLVASPVTFALIVVMSVAFTPGSPLAPAGVAGLAERVVIVEILAWYVAFGWRLLTGARPYGGAAGGLRGQVA